MAQHGAVQHRTIHYDNSRYRFNERASLRVCVEVSEVAHLQPLLVVLKLNPGQLVVTVHKHLAGMGARVHECVHVCVRVCMCVHVCGCLCLNAYALEI